MKTYTFTEAQLKALLQATLDRFTDQEGVFDFSPAFTAKPVAIDETMANIESDEDIPFNGNISPIDGLPVFEAEDNISPAAIGLQEAM